MDTQKTGDVLEFKPVSELKTAYEQIIPSKKSRVIVHCRTGHQASQTFFVLKHLLGYEQILWYVGGSHLKSKIGVSGLPIIMYFSGN